MTSLTSSATSMIARQAIIDPHNKVIGYELFNRSRTTADNTAASDMALLLTALSHAEPEDIIGTKLLFVSCTHESLSAGHLDVLAPTQIVLEIPPLGHTAREEASARLPILAKLRAQGFRLAFNHNVLESTYAPWLQLADFIKLDLSLLPPDQLAVMIQYARRHSRAQLIAEKIQTQPLFEAASRQGIELFQGYWFARPTVVQTKLLTPAHAHIIELINLLRMQANTEALEEVLKKDAGLAFNLLRLINSASFGLNREVSSFRQAVMFLGQKKLFRWAALLLTATRDGGPPPPVCQTAVVRGRFMELLALACAMDETQADQAFVTGLFSLLDSMLPLQLERALALINVPEAVAAALLKGQGELAELLDLVKACEANNDGAFHLAAHKLQLSSMQINSAHLQALAWTDHLATDPL